MIVKGFVPGNQCPAKIGKGPTMRRKVSRVQPQFWRVQVDTGSEQTPTPSTVMKSLGCAEDI